MRFFVMSVTLQNRKYTLQEGYHTLYGHSHFNNIKIILSQLRTNISYFTLYVYTGHDW